MHVIGTTPSLLFSESMSNPGFIIALLLVYVCAFGIQCLALFCLWLQRKQKRARNQRIIITSLCLGESSFLLLWIVRFSITLNSDRSQSDNVTGILRSFLRFVVAFHYVITMHIVAVDRFLEVYLHLKYRALVTRRVILTVITVSWVSSGVFGAVLVTLSQTVLTGLEIDHFAFHFFFVADLTFLTSALSIYTYLYVKYRQMKATARRNNPFLTNNKARFLTPLFIILTNVVFQNTASFLSMFNYLSPSTFADEEDRNVRNISLLLFGLGHISDPLIYIIFNPIVAKRTGHLSITKTARTAKRVQDESSHVATSFDQPSS